MTKINLKLILEANNLYVFDIDKYAFDINKNIFDINICIYNLQCKR